MNFKKFAEEIEKGNDCAYNMHTGDFRYDGWLVGGFGDDESVPLRTLTKSIATFIEHNQQVLTNNALYVDAVHDGDEVILRAVRIADKLDDALQLGFENQQEYVMNAEDGTQVRVPNAGVVRVLIIREGGQIIESYANATGVVITELTQDEDNDPTTVYWPDEGPTACDMVNVEAAHNNEYFELNSNFGL